jgi:hypothetical protein
VVMEWLKWYELQAMRVLFLCRQSDNDGLVSSQVSALLPEYISKSSLSVYVPHIRIEKNYEIVL